MFVFKNTYQNAEYDRVMDVPPQDVFENLDKVRLVDVRQPEEFTGELGHIPGAELVPLATLPDAIGKFTSDLPTVFICRSGGRSARACEFVTSLGIAPVYNMAGGMILWNRLQLKVETK